MVTFALPDCWRVAIISVDPGCGIASELTSTLDSVAATTSAQGDATLLKGIRFEFRQEFVR